MGRSFSSGGPKGAVNGKPTARLRAHNHAEGLTRRLRRGRWGCRPDGGSTFFRSERKYQRKHAARRLREKGFYCPFCRRGSQRRAQFSWTANPIERARSCAHLFLLAKWACLFPSAAYRRSAPPRLAVSKLKRMSVGMLRRDLNISQTKRPAQVQIRAGLSASHEACRRMAAFSIQLTESHTEPASHGACCATAVKPRPSRMSLYTPARQRRAEKGAGHSPASWMRPSSCRRMRLPVRGSPSSVGAEQVLEMWKR